MLSRRVAIFVSLFIALAAHGLRAAEVRQRPNIVYILCDDLGYGDVKCLNPQGKIATPQLDRLAAGGMIFTDAHSGSSVCSPTRYGIMTGRYAWRSRLKQGVLGGLSPRLIEPDRMTVASFLQAQGYHTACVGKWHLGMDWVKREGKSVTELGIETVDQVNNVDYARPTKNGPCSVGFDEYFGISGSLDMVPYTFIANDRVVGLPTDAKKFALMAGRAGGFTREGPAAPDFDAVEVLPTLTKQAVEVVKRQASAARGGKPFFLYVPLASPHTPIAPSAAWQGKSGLNPYADFVMQTDACIGEIVQAIDEQKLSEHTLFIVTSDNGCSPLAKIDELQAKGHEPSFIFRGAKADIFDGGHHIPFIARWPAAVKPGSRSDQLTCLGDLLATCADILGQKLPDSAGEDSVSMLPALLGEADHPLRESIVHHSVNGTFAIRRGRWKLVLSPDSGGWSNPKPTKQQLGELPAVQLCDMQEDPSERVNVQAQHSDIVAELTALLERQVADGRSTPGAKQSNTTPVDIWRAIPENRRPQAKSAAKS